MDIVLSTYGACGATTLAKLLRDGYRSKFGWACAHVVPAQEGELHPDALRVHGLGGEETAPTVRPLLRKQSIQRLIFDLGSQHSRHLVANLAAEIDAGIPISAPRIWLPVHSFGSHRAVILTAAITLATAVSGDVRLYTGDTPFTRAASDLIAFGVEIPPHLSLVDRIGLVPSL